jgi:hypothetical protein
VTPVDENESAECRPQTALRNKVEIPDVRLASDGSTRLQVNVLYTTPSGTRTALTMASRLSADLHACSEVLRLYGVPYSLPLEKPAVPIVFLEEQIRALARHCPAAITARIILCRDPRAILCRVLPPHSLIVIGGQKRWWPTREQRLASALRKDGHDVIFVAQE